LLEKAEEKRRADEAKRGADVLIESLVDELKSARGFDVVDMRAKIGKAFDAATTIEQRGRVLAIFKVTMDRVEGTLTNRGEVALLADIKKARAQDYKIFIAQESTVGLDSPGGGQISIEVLMAVTNREIEAGRMTEDHSMRKIAVEGAAAPHFSHTQMLANDAKVREQAGQANTAPKTAPGSAAVAYGVGAMLGKKLKGLFRK
jgi:hypothetical protein